VKFLSTTGKLLMAAFVVVASVIIYWLGRGS
jgi:hypothetical protein